VASLVEKKKKKRERERESEREREREKESERERPWQDSVKCEIREDGVIPAWKCRGRLSGT
jgi:hypothetical protein